MNRVSISTSRSEAARPRNYSLEIRPADGILFGLAFAAAWSFEHAACLANPPRSSAPLSLGIGLVNRHWSFHEHCSQQ
jgi:hypothetical protein